MSHKARPPSYSVYVRFRKARLTMMRKIPDVARAIELAEQIRAERFHDRENVIVVLEPDGTIIDESKVAWPAPAAIDVRVAERMDDLAQGIAGEGSSAASVSGVVRVDDEADGEAHHGPASSRALEQARRALERLRRVAERLDASFAAAHGSPDDADPIASRIRLASRAARSTAEQTLDASERLAKSFAQTAQQLARRPARSPRAARETQARSGALSGAHDTQATG